MFSLASKHRLFPIYSISLAWRDLIWLSHLHLLLPLSDHYFSADWREVRPGRREKHLLKRWCPLDKGPQLQEFIENFLKWSSKKKLFNI